MVRISGFHPGDPGSIPGGGVIFRQNRFLTPEHASQKKQITIVVQMERNFEQQILHMSERRLRVLHNIATRRFCYKSHGKALHINA